MRILVTAASRHAATAELASRLAEELADALRRRGVEPEIDVRPPQRMDRLGEYDAVVLGSAVYAGRWMRAARVFAERNVERLAARPVWLFSSGPVGDPPLPVEPIGYATRLARRIGARGHRVFAGRLDLSRLGPAERAVIRAVHAAEGDYRDWAEVAAWAVDIAAALQPLGVGPATR